jgi:hypothetical protein
MYHARTLAHNVLGQNYPSILLMYNKRVLTDGASFLSTLHMLMLRGKEKSWTTTKGNKMVSSSEDNMSSFSYHNNMSAFSYHSSMSAFSYNKTAAKEHSILRQLILLWDSWASTASVRQFLVEPQNIKSSPLAISSEVQN